ncbi:tyrosine-protein phosphatase [Cumulibacter soli]|uniref:tyrosine-protein phosphatase n=1 Tax=Cumulibacter soli TaxID=2546344 RepID=UPI0010672803|nr:tyrosine-protein phosphatase [Cumulibacter soli]
MTIPVMDQLVNLRDVADAVPAITPGILLRSDAPYAGDRHDYRVTWPPRTVVDLRDLTESDSPNPLAQAARVHHLPLLDGRARDVSAMPPSLGELYLTMLCEPAASRLVAAIELIATGPAPVLVHCAAGKDRTGVTIALALALVGIDDEAITADYALTAAAMDDVHARLGTTHAHLTADVLGSIPEDFMTAAPESIGAVLAEWRSRRSGALGWYLDHGGSARTVALLRERLLLVSTG